MVKSKVSPEKAVTLELNGNRLGVKPTPIEAQNTLDIIK